MLGSESRLSAPYVAASAVCLCAVFQGGCLREPDRADGSAIQTPAAPAAAGTGEKPISSPTSWFTEITQESGLRFTYVEGAKGTLLLPEMMGSGVAVFDLDNDGRLDLCFTNGHGAFPDLSKTDGTPDRLFRQVDGGKFVDVTERSGLGDTGYGMGVAIGDIDNDGFQDVFVTNLGPDRLYRNRGDSTFENITSAAGIAVDGWSASACFFDYDADGFLDLYISRYVVWHEQRRCFAPDGRLTYCGPLAFPPIHDVLLHNNTDGTFTDVTDPAGISSVSAAGLGVVCQDFNGDGRQDVYVANDAYANQLWINQGDGTFRDEAFEMGAAYNLAGAPQAGMGVVAADFDNDGNDDLYITHLAQESNTLYRNMGAGIGFNDVTSESGLSWSSIPHTGFGVSAFDVELDGDLDIFLVNGRVKRGDLIPGALVPPPWDVLAEPSLFYLNDGSGRFEAITTTVSLLVSPVEIGRGLACGDMDSDGDLDLVRTNIRGPSRLFRNDTPRKGHWLTLEPFDPRLRRAAIGARVTVVSDEKRYTRVISAATSYLSSSDPRAHFGVPDGGRVTRLEVDWPDGLREHFTPPPVDSFVRLVRGTGASDGKSDDLRVTQARP